MQVNTFFARVVIALKYLREQVYTSVVQMYTISSGSKLQGLVQQLVEFWDLHLNIQLSSTANSEIRIQLLFG